MRRREDREGARDELVHVQPQPALDEHAHDAQRVAAQRVRVLVAAGQLADAEQPGQRLELVGQRQRQSGLAARQRIAGKARPVLVLDGLRDGLGLAVVARVVAAHHALQFGKLADHVGQQVGLGQLRGARGLLRQRRAAEPLADRRGQRRHARDALAHRAEASVVDDAGQPRQARLEAAPAVLVVEELRVGQPWPHDALVARDHARRVGRAHVGDDQEALGEPPLRVEQREILLVGLHRQDQAFLRHREEGRVEAADQHVRALDQRRHLVEQRLVGVQGQAFLHRGHEQLALDLAPALVEAGDDRALVGELLFVAVGLAQHDALGARLEAVAARQAAGRQPERANRHDLGAMQRDQAMRRAYELHAGPAVGELVAHELGDRQLRDGLVERLLQAHGQRRAGHDGLEQQQLGLAVVAPLQRRYGRRVGAERGELLQQCRGRLASGVEPDGRRHQPELLCRVRCACPDVLDPHREAPRRGKAFAGLVEHAAGRDELLVGQRRQQGPLKGLAQRFQRLGRQFLDQQLDEQVARDRHHHATPRCCSIWASAASAQARGASGKPSRARLST